MKIDELYRHTHMKTKWEYSTKRKENDKGMEQIQKKNI